jgi:UDP-N-acetyl-D-glucosamine dehydrogenase
VTGIDIDRKKVESVNAGLSYLRDVPDEELLALVSEGKLRATQALAVLRELDTVSICVPTPIRKTKDPDLSYLLAAAQAIRNHLRPGQLIALESTTYPGTTQEVLLPVLEKSGLQVGRDFFLVYSPEGIGPPRQKPQESGVTKVVGGVTAHCTELGVLLYEQLVGYVVPVSSAGTAEMIRLVENVFNTVNAALANEVALVCHKFGIDVWEVIEASNTQSSDRTTFLPGPAAWSRAIAGDSYYLTWKAKMNGYEPRLIELAGQINSQIGSFVTSRVADALNERKKSVKGSRILVLGLARQRDAGEACESPAVEVLRDLHLRGAVVRYSDPNVPWVDVGGQILRSVEPTPETLRTTDCVVVLVDHPSFDYAAIASHSRLILDSGNVLKRFSGRHILRL